LVTSKNKHKKDINMSAAPELLSVEIPASMLADPDLFERQREEAYEITDATERGERLGQLIGTAALKQGEGSLSDEVLEIITSPEAAGAKDYAERARGVFQMVSKAAAREDRRYRIEVDQNGNPVGLFKIDRIPVDIQDTKRQQRMAKSVGWGPKQNDSSGHTHYPINVR
jgi:hypothetical protein